MTPGIHWLLLANGVFPIVWVLSGEQGYMGLCQAMTWVIFAMTILNLVAAGAVWP